MEFENEMNRPEQEETTPVPTEEFVPQEVPAEPAVPAEEVEAAAEPIEEAAQAAEPIEEVTETVEEAVPAAETAENAAPAEEEIPEIRQDAAPEPETAAAEEEPFVRDAFDEKPAAAPEEKPQPPRYQPSLDDGYYRKAYPEGNRPTEQPYAAKPADAQTEKVKKKKAKKEKKGGLGVGKAFLLLLLCLLISVSGGFGGAMIAHSVRGEEPTHGPNGPFEDESTAPEDKPKPKPENTTSGDSELTESDEENQKIRSVKQIAAMNEDAVVEINIEYTEYFFYRETTRSGAGSGVILTDDGYIVTNCHVIDTAEDIHVRLHNGDWYDAALVGFDRDHDIAVVKIEAENLTHVTVGDSSKLTVGDLCVAIGNPLGTLGGTVTDGIVSALDRDITFSDGTTQTLIQHNAAISPGNSGGGLFDENGNLIGIVNAKSVGDNVEGIGFAIPINSVKTLINDLIHDGYVHGKFTLGITMLNISDDAKAQYYNVSECGIYISEVEKDSNAERGGLMAGDLIRSVNGTKVKEFDDVKNVLANCKAGDVMHFVVSRDGQDLNIDVTLYESVPESFGA